MALALSDYIYRTRRLLRDASSTFWDTTQINTWINKGRNDVCILTGSSRSLALISCVQGQEAYQFSTVLAQIVANGLPAQSVNQILNVSFLPNPSLRYPLRRCEFSRYNNLYRQLTTFQGWPTIWSVLGYQAFYTMPIPSSGAFQFEVDSLYTPNPLVNTTDLETVLPDPWADLVPLKAAKWAKFYEEAYQDSDVFEAKFLEQLSEMGGALPMWQGGDDFYG